MADTLIRVEAAGKRQASIFIIRDGIKVCVSNEPLDIEMALYAATEVQKQFNLPDEKVIVSNGLLKRLGIK